MTRAALPLFNLSDRADIVVSSADGRHTPSRLLGIHLVTDNGELGPAIDMNINDTGSATTLLGESDADEWSSMHHGSVRRVPSTGEAR